MIPQFRMGVTASEIFHPSSGGTDPHFSDVILLLHGNGADGSTVAVDSSSYARTSTSHNGAKISTLQSPFGGGSMLFNGVNQWFSFPTAAELDLIGTFTAELFFYPNSLPGVSGFITKRVNGGDAGWNLYGSGNTPAVYSSFAGSLASSGATMALHAWNNVVFVHDAGVMQMWVNGTRVQNAAYANFGSTAYDLMIGSGRNDEYFVDGHMAEVRLTKVARYSGATITVPTAPFPNS